MLGTHRNPALKIILAAVSGLCCWAVSAIHWDTGESTGLEFLRAILPGALFAVGVLFPYLKHGRSFWYRGIALLILGCLSWMTAVLLAEWIHYARSHWSSQSIDPLALMLASVLGAFIALAGARYIVPLHHSAALAISGLTAAIIGGLAFVFLHTDSTLMFAFVTWHSLMAAAIHVAEYWPLRPPVHHGA